MTTSYNGWSASPSLDLRPLVVEGIAFAPGIRDDDDVATVLGYVAAQFHKRVEPLRNPGCWGFSYRPNRNDPSGLSNHSSGTAIDVNAPAHPNGVPTANTFTADQRGVIHRILYEAGGVVRWGGDYSGTPDAMHFEINASAAAVAVAAEHIRTLEDEMANYAEQLDRIEKQGKDTAAALAKLRKGSLERDRRLIKKVTGVDADLKRIEAAVGELGEDE